MLVLVLMAAATAAAAAPDTARAPDPFATAAAPTPQNEIDRLVFARWKQRDLEPARLCSDAVFVRRAYLDVIGTLPTALQAREFILDTRPDKRRVLIDQLLAREEFADYWAMKWSDLLRVKAEFPINLWPNAAQAYHRWIRTSLRENKPYDQFARELLTASGSNFRVGPVNFYRALQNKEPAGIAQAVALTFLGARADRWPSNELAGLTAFFSQVGYKSTDEWKEEVVFHDPAKATNGLWRSARFPDGPAVKLAPDHDPRQVFAEWLIDPKNPWFTRNIANRIWSWLVGRGIIHEPDDIRADNPPSDPELLAYLERELVSAKYDLRQLYRLILTSSTYQLASLSPNPGASAATNFAAYPLRRLEAELLIDALNQITGSTEEYVSQIPEPFTRIPPDQRAIALPDASITSPFLELFGRPPRDTGLESERSNRPTAAQRLHLLNSSHIQRKLEQSRMVQFHSQGNKPPREIATGMYLGILSRFPTEAEVTAIQAYFQSGSVSRREAVVDTAWALLNSSEFLYRH